MDQKITARMILGLGCFGFAALVACAAPVDDTESDESALASTCGNGVRDPGEQCDDGNTTNLDGCDSSCRFEQTHRMNSLAMMFQTDGFCTANAIGTAISSQAHGQLQDALTNSVKNGDVSVMLKFMNLSDLSGTNGTGVIAGSVLGKPVEGPGYDGTNDLDWWYTADPTSLDESRNPTGTLTGNITNRKLAAGPGNLTMKLALAGAPAAFNLSNVRVRGTVGAMSAPKSSAGSTPGHLASENLDPALKSFATIGEGQMCANLSAGSLAKIGVPPELTSGSYACSQGYTTQNTMLDLFTGGCRVFIVNAIAATQPDQVVGAAPPGGKYVFTRTGTKVTGCKDGAGNSVALATCLDKAAYSGAFKFTTDRVIIK